MAKKVAVECTIVHCGQLIVLSMSLFCDDTKLIGRDRKRKKESKTTEVETADAFPKLIKVK